MSWRQFIHTYIPIFIHEMIFMKKENQLSACIIVLFKRKNVIIKVLLINECTTNLGVHV